MTTSLMLGRLSAIAAMLSVATFAGLSTTSAAQAEAAKIRVSPAIEHRGNLARNARRRAPALRGILKEPRVGQRKLGGGNKAVRFDLTPRRPGPGYANQPYRANVARELERRGNIARAARKPAHSLHHGARAARHADKARKVRATARAAKLARGAKYLAAGTGVGAAVGLGASLVGLDPIEMAALKATNPAEYQRRMRDLKKNPMKYMGKNIKNNTKKVGNGIKNGAKKIGGGIKNGTKKIGQGFKNVFAKKKR